MESAIENQCSALGGLFNSIINDMKGSFPVWEDFICKASKLHTTLRATILATSAFLDAFQKVADIATNTKGATRDIGSALTRLCMRHRSIENRLKAFTSSIMDCLVTPLQERTEDWKKSLVQLDKDHAKEYKKAKAEIKRASIDTVRLQKKAKKESVLSMAGKGELQNRLDNAMQDVNSKYMALEETEKNSVRMALIEERSRFCMFITCLKPVVDEEMAMLTEVTHLQEIIEQLCLQVSEPHALPPASEQVIKDIKGTDAQNFFQPQTPPSSPSSLGSRKSSMCSISSTNSSSSGSTKSHSPSHHVRYRNQPPPGTVRLPSVSSQDSGFTSQDTLFMRPPSPPSLDFSRQNMVPEHTDSNSSTPLSPYPGSSSSASTWTNWPDPPHITRQDPNMFERPHTISTAYERSHNRPALTAHTFDPPDILERPQAQTAPSTPSPYARPFVPQDGMSTSETRPPLGPKPTAKPVAPPTVPNLTMMPGNQFISHPVYVNMSDLANMAAQKQREREQQEMENEIPLSDSQDTTPTEAHPEPNKRNREMVADTDTQLSMPAQTSDVSALTRVIEELNNSTAALRNSPSNKKYPIDFKSPNSSELADAIKELEASTAALQMAYDTQTSHSSLQSSSGYGTLSSTPSGSEDTVASDEVPTGKEVTTAPPDKFSTIPRNGDVSNCFKVPYTPKRPASTAGMSMISTGTATIRRSSVTGGKPPPPVRRNSSITGATPVSTPTVPGTDGFPRSSSGTRSGSTTPTPQTTPTHKRRATIDVSSSAMHQVLYGQEVIYQQPHVLPAGHQPAQPAEQSNYTAGAAAMYQAQAAPPQSQYAALSAAVPQEMNVPVHYSQPPQYAPIPPQPPLPPPPPPDQMSHYAEPEPQRQHIHPQVQPQYAQGLQGQYAQGQLQYGSSQQQSQSQYVQGQPSQNQLPSHYAQGQQMIYGQQGQSVYAQGQQQYAQNQQQYAQNQHVYAQGQQQYTQNQHLNCQGEIQGHLQYAQGQEQHYAREQFAPGQVIPNPNPPHNDTAQAAVLRSGMVTDCNKKQDETPQNVKVKHASLMQSLNEKLATGKPSPDRRASCPEGTSQSGLLNQLNSVKLRKVSTNDRSAPRLS